MSIKMLKGVVTDISLKPITNVQVFASDKDGNPAETASGQRLGAYTDDSGHFQLPVPYVSTFGINTLAISHLTARPAPNVTLTLKASASKDFYHFDFKEERYQDVTEVIARPKPQEAGIISTAKPNWWIIGGVGLIGVVVAIVVAKKASK